MYVAHDRSHATTNHPPLDRQTLDTHRYLSLRTFRRDGTSVPCPVWFAADSDASRIWFRTKRDTAKVRRIAANPSVTVAPCDWKGRVVAGHAVLHGDARLIAEASPDWSSADAALSERYGWKWNTVPLFRIPMTKTVKTDMSLVRKIRHIRAGAPLPDSCLIEIELRPG